MALVKITQVGGALGVVLPEEVLAELEVSEGDTLVASSVPGGIKLSRADQTSDAKVADQIEAGSAFARDYAETLRALAK